MGRKVFISYSSRDRPDALRIKEIAEADGHDAWMDLFDIRPAERLAGELEQGVRNADVLCVLLSPSAVASPWVREELRYALTAEANGLRVMPVILRSAPISDELADHVALDATRGLTDDATVMRIRRALGGDVEDAILLDALRRSELADRAAIDEAEEALEGRRQALARAMDAPIRELLVSIDQDTWPADVGGVLEIDFNIDIYVGALSILLAPYVEGHTWPPHMGFVERPADDFFGASKPRVDARLVWAGRTVTAARVQDATDLGEFPSGFTFRLPGDEYTGAERATTLALLERFELPSLSKLIDKGASVKVWWFPGDGGAPQEVDPRRTDLGLRLRCPLRRDEVGISGFDLWRDFDRLDGVLWQAPTVQGCSSDLERVALLSTYRDRPLRAEQGSDERRQRIEVAVDGEGPIEASDLWAAFHLAAQRAKLPRFRGAVREAALYGHAAVDLLGSIDLETLDYTKAFRLLETMTTLIEDLARSGGTTEAIDQFSDAVVDLATRLCELHPDEPDYRRALSLNLIQRARLHAGTPGSAEDANAAVRIIDRLVENEPFPWRVEEARARRSQAQAVLAAAASSEGRG